MAIYDRDYYRGGGGSVNVFGGRTVVGTIIIVNVAVFLLQLVTSSRQDPGGGLTDFLACSPEDLFGGFPQVWKLVTANFAHSTQLLTHILFNMLILFFFGREIEQIYGKRDFLILYLVAGVLAIFCEVLVLQITGRTQVTVLGASGSVLAVVTAFATFFPHRTVLFMFVIPMPIWLLCVFIIAVNVLGAFSPTDGTANFAHLAGAAFGFLHARYDLRWHNVRRYLPALGSGGRRRRRRPEAQRRPQRETEREAHVSRRIDELLAKISRDGMGSLTEEERQFLLENSHRYRSS